MSVPLPGMTGDAPSAPTSRSLHIVARGEERSVELHGMTPGVISVEVPPSAGFRVGQPVHVRMPGVRGAPVLASFEVTTVEPQAGLETGVDRARCDGQHLLVGLCPIDAAARSLLWLLLRDGDPLADTSLHLRACPDVPEVALEKLPGRGLDCERSRLERLAHLRERTTARLETVQHTRLVPEQLANNIENLLGSVEIPVGVAGPLWFSGQHARGTLFMPFATTEGALVASATRGARAMTESGGVTTRVLGQRMMRVPFFSFCDLSEAALFATWVRDHETAIKAEATKVSRHASLTHVEPVVMGRAVHVRFVYETGDAAGQNMTTACTWQACQWILREIAFLPLTLENFLVEANLSGDKKATFASLVNGRGMRVSAECRLSGSVLRRVLKVEQDQLLRSSAAIATGSAHVGSIGHNINVANVVAAAFTACGQDIACVHESSLAVLHIEPWRDGVYATITLPSLIVGTVGGGTGLPHQRDYLDLLGCAGPDKVERFAEAIAGFCLGLDLSTLAAVASGQFATAHERLGRNRPVDYLQLSELSAPYLTKMLRDHVGTELQVTAVRETKANVGSSIITELSARRNTGKLLGFHARQLTIEHVGAHSEQVEVLLKIKPLAGEVLTVLHTLASAAGPEVSRLLREHERDLGFDLCEVRELEVYKQRDPRFVRHAPRVYAAHADPKREVYLLVLEKLDGLELMNVADDLDGYTTGHRRAAIRGLARLHAIWLGREAELANEAWLGSYPTRARMLRMRELFAALAQHARQEFPEWVGERAYGRWQQAISMIDATWDELEEMPRTLIHNDFNARNVAYRRVQGELELCAYDWELATLHVPQRDLAEFLAFTLDASCTREEVDAYLHLHRRELAAATGRALDPVRWERGFVLGLRDLLVMRVALYTMGHACRDYRFLPRVFRTLMALLSLYDHELCSAADGAGSGLWRTLSGEPAAGPSLAQSAELASDAVSRASVGLQ